MIEYVTLMAGKLGPEAVLADGTKIISNRRGTSFKPGQAAEVLAASDGYSVWVGDKTECWRAWAPRPLA